MNCGCNSTPTTPTSVNTPNILLTLSAPVRYEGDTLEPFLSWTLAETDLDVRFEYVFRDTFEFTTGEQYQQARIEVATDAEGAGLTRAGADKLRVVPLLSDALTTVHVNASVAKGLYWRIVAVCPGTQEELEATDHSLLEYSSLTLTPSATPVTPSTPSCDCACDPCAPSTHCHVPPPMPVVVVPGVNNTLPACEGPNTFESVSSFTVPALEASGPLRVCDPAKYPVGTCAFLSDGTTSATLRVVSRDLGAKTIQLENYGAPGSAAAGTVFGSTSVVSPLGPCPTQAAESCARAGWELGEAFTPLAATVDTDIVVEPCMDVVVGQNLFIEGAGWFTVKSVDEVTEEASSFTVWTHTLLPGVTAGTTVIASGQYVIADEPQLQEEFSPTAGDITEFWTGGEVTAPANTVNHTNPGSKAFTTLWPADVEIMWKVGHRVTVSNNDGHTHWKITLDGVTKSDASNDADLSGYMASSNWGRVVVEDVAAGAHTAAIVFSGLNGDPIPDLDTWVIQITAHRKQASVS